MAIGLGPVFTFEWLRTARNWRVYAFRVVFGLALLGVLGVVALSSTDPYAPGHAPTIQEQAAAGQAFSVAIVMTQLGMILLVAPAATAGTLCLDRQRGTLAHVMSTDLTNAEVVLGKLFARMLPVFGLVFASLGVISLCTLMGGIDPMGLMGSLLVSLGCALLAGTLAFLLSVWAGKTHEVIMGTYVILLIWLLAYPTWWIIRNPFMGLGPPKWLEDINPFLLIAEVRPGRVPLEKHALFASVCVAISALMTLVAVWRIRAAAISQMNRSAVRRKRRWWGKKGVAGPRPEVGPGRFRRLVRRFSPSLDRNPVLWREWHRMKPSWWSRIIWYVYAAFSLAATLFTVFLLLVDMSRSSEAPLIIGNALQLAIGLLLLSVTAATALAEERVRGSLDVLLTTPLSTRTILAGKWWGTYRTVPVLAVLPAVMIAGAVTLFDPSTRWFAAGSWRPATGLAALWGDRWQALPLMIGLTLAYGAAITSFGLAMATWISRLDRAVAATVAMYLILAVAWPFLMAMLSSVGGDHLTAGLATISPFMGAGYTGVLVIERPGQQAMMWRSHVAWSTFWILANFTVAAVLFKLTLMGFNRKLGRIPDEGIAKPPTPEVGAERVKGSGWRIRSRGARPAAHAATTGPPPR